MRLPISVDELRNTVERLAQQKEKMILDQLDDLVKEGLLVIEQGPMSLVQMAHNNEMIVAQEVKIVLRDKEYIQSLKDEIEALKRVLKNI